MPDVPTQSDLDRAKELLESSQRLRENLLGAVGKLDSYIEQLKDALPEVPDATPRT